MISSDNFKERLKLVIGNSSVLSFAKKCGISEGAIRNYLKGQTTPDLDNLVKIAEGSGSFLPWLASGEGPMKGFAVQERGEGYSAQPADKPGYSLDVSEEILETISKLFNEKAGERRNEISADKTILLTMTLYRFYSSNFIGSEEFRRKTLEKNVDSLIKLALPEK